MWFLFIHGILAIWICIDSLKRKANIVFWFIATAIFGPIILPLYITRRPLEAGESRENGRLYDLLKNLSIFWTILLVVVCIWGQKKNINSAVENDTLEYRLAVINCGGYVRKDDNTVARFHNLLDQLSMNCVEDREQIANISVITHKKIKVHGINESMLDIMEDLNKLFNNELKNERYSKCVFAYVGLRNKGLSHDDAIERLKGEIMGY